MPLRDLLKKKDHIDREPPLSPSSLPQATEFTFFRTDTQSQEPEFIHPPGADHDSPESNESPRKGFSRFRRNSRSSPGDTSPSSSRDSRRISQRLNLRKDRSASTSSTHLPQNLPHIEDDFKTEDREDKEAQWEDRATRLASKSPSSAGFPPTDGMAQLNLKSPSRSPSRPRSVSDAASDVNIQEAIRLHEAGQLERATDMFHQLAEQGNVLSQVLFGLSLRHGWGCKPDAQRAVTYLSQAAANSAEVEAQALQAGMKKGGAAKGELVLAIFELANCFRNGWGVPIDKAAARQYYETAANLGDTDAMNEAAWCYLEGFGGKKDKVSRAPCGPHPSLYVYCTPGRRPIRLVPSPCDPNVTIPQYHARRGRYQTC